MKFCNNCGNSVPDNEAVCSNCGKDLRLPKQEEAHYIQQQPAEYDDTFLKVLCTLTIVGASISLISLAFTFDSRAEAGIIWYLMQIVNVLVAIGKMTAAILMLQKRLTGLYIYTVAGSITVLLTVAMAFGFNKVSNDDAVPEAVILTSFIIAIAISVAFIVMYWLKVNRRLLS